MPMDIEWALEKDKFVYCSGSPHYCLTAGVGIAGKECSLHKGQFGRTPAKSSHTLFATLGLELVNRASALLWVDMFDTSAKSCCQTMGHTR